MIVRLSAHFSDPSPNRVPHDLCASSIDIGFGCDCPFQTLCPVTDPL